MSFSPRTEKLAVDHFRRATILWLALLLAACRPAHPAVGDELIINGGFEIPVVPAGPYLVGTAPPAPKSTGGDTHIINGIVAGAEPPGFGWKVEDGDVDVVGFGYDSGGGNLFLGTMAEGTQHLDLDGKFGRGTLAQTIPTEGGGVYALTFAFSNNPDPDAGVGRTFLATVTVVDSASGENLAEPLVIKHANSTSADYRWSRASPLKFTAHGDHAIVRFTSGDSLRSIHGIGLDDVSVKIVSRPIFTKGDWQSLLLPVAVVAALILVIVVLVASHREKQGLPPD